MVCVGGGLAPPFVSNRPSDGIVYRSRWLVRQPSAPSARPLGPPLIPKCQVPSGSSKNHERHDYDYGYFALLPCRNPNSKTCFWLSPELGVVISPSLTLLSCVLRLLSRTELNRRAMASTGHVPVLRMWRLGTAGRRKGTIQSSYSTRFRPGPNQVGSVLLSIGFLSAADRLRLHWFSLA